jgi:hypothetical protein
VGRLQSPDDVHDVLMSIDDIEPPADEPALLPLPELPTLAPPAPAAPLLPAVPVPVLLPPAVPPEPLEDEPSPSLPDIPAAAPALGSFLSSLPLLQPARASPAIEIASNARNGTALHMQ